MSIIHGTSGNDFKRGTTGADSIDGGTAGNDQLLGLAGNDTLDGGSGDDTLDGGVGNDSLLGGTGNDNLIGGAGNDTLNGGTGTDTAIYNTAVLTTDMFTVKTGYWQVASGAVSAGGENTDRLYNTEIVQDAAGNRYFLVGNGGFATIQDAVNAADDGDIILIDGGTYSETVSVIGKALSILGNGAKLNGEIDFTGTITGDTVVKGLTINAASHTYGISFVALSADVDGTGAGGTLTVDHVTIGGAQEDGLLYTRPGNSSSPSNTDQLLSAITVTNSTFTDNGKIGGSSGRGEVNLFGFNGDLTFTGNTFTAPATYNATGAAGADSTRKGFAWTGAPRVDNPAAEGSLSTAGNVVFSNNSFTGAYGTDVIELGYHAGFASFTASGNSANVTAGVGSPKGWPVLNFDTVGGNIDVSGFFSSAANSGTGGVISALQGTTGSQTLTGTDGVDQIVGNGGADVLNGLGGADVIVSGSASDTIDAGAGDDVVFAVAGAVSSHIAGGSGADTLVILGTGSVALTGVTGVETVSLTSGAVTSLNASAASGVTAIIANNLGDTIIAAGDAQAITGGTGADSINGGGGHDTILAGAGNDTIVTAGGDSIDGGTGTDLVQSSVSFSLATDAANVENLTLTGTAAINGAGTSSANVITGNSGANLLDGAGGADTLMGGSGNDTIVAHGGESIDGGDGTDTVFADVSYDLSDMLTQNVENLTLTGTGNINGVGNGGDNVITGNSGDNIINGGGGTDTLAGGQGNDIYVISDAGKTVVEAAGEGTDEVQSELSFTLSANVENLTLLGTNNISGTGNSGDNVITGNEGSNLLDGAGGADSLAGGLGDDTIVTDGGDSIDGGDGIDLVMSSVTFNLGTTANVENLTLAGTADINGTGTSDANVITGNSGANLLDGAGGADTLMGGSGNDTIVSHGGESIDGGADTDTVTTTNNFNLATQATNVENLTLTGSANLTGTGTGGANLITGNSGDNVLDGAGGADTILAGAGNDTIVAHGGESIDGGSGTDLVQSAASFDLHSTTGVENLTLTGTADIDGTGTSGDNVITGNSGANVIDGAGGHDTIVGGAGMDTVHFSTTLTAADFSYNGSAWVVNDGTNSALLTGIEKVTDSTHTFELVGGSSDVHSLQVAIDSASGGETLLVAAGTYNELTNLDESDFSTFGTGSDVGNPIGLVVNKSVSILGFANDGHLATSASDVAANIHSLKESNWGSSMIVTADNVTIQGLGLYADSSVFWTNKLLEVTGDNLTITKSVLGEAAGTSAGSAIYFNNWDGTAANAIGSYAVSNNVIHGSVDITNGTGLTAGDSAITGNTFFMAQADGWGGINYTGERASGWNPESVGATDVVAGNTFASGSQYWLLRGVDATPANNVVTLGFVQDFLANNTVSSFAYATNAAETALASHDVSYGAPVTYLFETATQAAQDGAAASGDHLIVYAGVRSSQAIATDNLSIKLLDGTATMHFDMADGVHHLTLLDDGSFGGDADVTGTDGADTIIGNSGHNRVDIAGADSVDGGAGYDYAMYSGNTADTLLEANFDGSYTATTGGAVAQLKHMELAVFGDNSAGVALNQVAAQVTASFVDTGDSDSDGITQVVVLTGTGRASTHVVISEGNHTVGSTTSDADGSWIITISPEALGDDGKYTLTATETDGAGNTSHAAVTFTLDTATSAPTIVLASDSSRPDLVGTGGDTDRVTNVKAPTFTGTAEAGAHVMLTDDGHLVGRANADSEGHWSITGPLQSGDGFHDISGVAVDIAGNTSSFGSLQIKLDTSEAAPSDLDLAPGSDTGLNDADNLTNATALTINGSGNDGDLVKLYDGATKVGEAIVDDGTWSIITSTLSQGAHVLTATQTDAANNVSDASASLTVTVDTTKPVAANPVVEGDADARIGSSSFTLAGTAEAFSKVDVSVDGTAYGSVRATDTGTWTLAVSVATDTDGGTPHAISTTETDRAGNVSANHGTLTVMVDQFEAAPTALTLDTDSTNGFTGANTDHRTNDATPTISGVAGAYDHIKLYEFDNVVGTADADGSGHWTITTSELSESGHTLLATATDDLGNISARSTGLAVTIDLTAATPGQPSLSTDSNISTDNITNIADQDITVAVEAGALVKLYDNGVMVGTATYADFSGHAVFSLTGLTDGSHVFKAQATDNANNASDFGSSLNVIIDTVKPTAATPAVQGDADGRIGTNSFTLTGTGETGNTIELFQGSTSLGTTKVVAGQWTMAVTVAMDTVGASNYTYHTVETDVAGNVSTASGDLHVTVDQFEAAPTALTLLTDSSNGFTGANTDGVTNDATPDISGTAGAYDHITLYEGGVAIGSADANGSGNWTITVGSDLTEGSHTLAAKATDDLGNVSAYSASLGITIDLTAATPGQPSLSADSGRSMTDNITNSASQTITVSAESGSLVRLYDNGMAVGTAVYASAGVATFSLTGLTDGTHVFKAKATDIANNPSGFGTALTATVDTVKPTAATPTVQGDSDNVLNTPTFTLTGTGENDGIITIFQDNASVGTAVVSGGVWSKVVTVAADTMGGTPHFFRTTEEDVAGNVSNASATLTVTLDQYVAAPVVTSLSVGAVDGSSVTVTGTAEAASTVTLTGTTSPVAALTSAGGIWSATGSVSAGSHTLAASIVDLGGNTAPSVDFFTYVASAAGASVTSVASNAVESITGGDGADTIDGNGGADSLSGGAGADLFVYHGAETINGGSGIDTVSSDAVSVNLTNGKFIAVENIVLGRSANLNATGDAASNQITGNSGNNILTGGGGSNTMDGGAGDDTYVVSSSTDVVSEAAGNGTDSVTASVSFTLGANIENLTLTTAGTTGTGNDLANVITASAGGNVLDGGAGADTLVGGAGNDTFVIGNVSDVYITNGGHDGIRTNLSYTLAADVFDLTLTGSDTITGTGNTSDNVITGNDAANGLTGGGGNDSLYGAGGNDTLSVSGTAAHLLLDGGSGIDTAGLGGFTSALVIDLSKTTAQTQSWGDLIITGVENVTGGTGNDSIIGDANANYINGGTGNDTIEGSLGADTLAGGNGTGDVLTFEHWNVGDNTGVVISMDTGTGAQNDNTNGILVFNITNNIAGGFEVLKGSAFGDVLTAATTLNATTGLPTTAGNLLMGLAGDDSLNGGGGNDTLDGGAGADVFGGGGGTNVVTYASAQAGVVVDMQDSTNNTGDAAGDFYQGVQQIVGSDFGDTMSGGNDSNADFTGLSSNATDQFADNFNGGAGDDSLSGLNGADTLVGGTGNDTIDGGAGNDSMDGGTGTDTVTFASATVAITVNLATTAAQATGMGSDVVINFENAIGGSGGDSLTGNTGNNLLDGGAGADGLNGGSGNDTLLGGAGTDVLTGGAGTDLLDGGSGKDTLTGGADADTFRWSNLTDSGSTASTADRVADFVSGTDKFDFSLLDANTAAGNAGIQHFSASDFLGVTGSFTGNHQIRVVKNAATTELHLNTDGVNNTDEMVIVLTGALNIVASDFIFS